MKSCPENELAPSTRMRFVILGVLSGCCLG